MPKGKIRQLIKDRLRHKSPDMRDLEVPVKQSLQHGSLDITGTRASADQSRRNSAETNRATATATVTPRDCHKALGDWGLKICELVRNVGQDSPIATALISAQRAVEELSYLDIRDEISPGSSEENKLFEAIVSIRRDFDKKYNEIENIWCGNSGGERPEATSEIIIDAQEIVDMVLNLVGKLPPRLQPEQDKIKDLKEKAKNLEKAVRDSHTAGPTYNMRNIGPGQQSIHSGTGTQNNNTGSGPIFSGPVSRGTYHMGQSAPHYH